MRFVPLLLAATLVASPLQAQTAASADNARAVLAAVLAHQVSIRGLESAAQTCVSAQLAPPPVAAGEEDPMIPDHAVRIYFQWHVPEAPAAIRPPPQPRPDGQRRRNRERQPPVVLPAAVPAELARQLDTLRAEAVRSTDAPAVAEVDAALLTAPMQLQDMNGGCAPLQLSAPGFAGDTAFVETGYACGTTCGNGSLYALQRREGRWQVVAVADTWIS
jgi:hypothetical protein